MDNVGWVSDPNGRGTAGLITSCVVTLCLCAWSALHLNIPPKGESRRAYWVRNLQWIFLGLIIPELVILSAWRQWASTRELHQQMGRILDSDEEGFGATSVSELDTNPSQNKETHGSPLSGTKSIRPEWTSLHDFYASMGGLAFDFDDTGTGISRFIPSKYQRLSLTPKGVMLLARCGFLPDIKAQDIKDKSKADGLAKAFVLLQAGWMLFQTIGRSAASLPVSLLEVNTVAHVFCAFVVYVLWWRKPREIIEPTVLRGTWANELAAFMFMSSRVSGKTPNSLFGTTATNAPELSRYDYVGPENRLVSREKGSKDSSDDDKTQTTDEVEAAFALTPQELITSTWRSPVGVVDEEQELDNFVPRLDLIDGDEPVAQTDDATRRRARFLLAAKAIQNFPAIRELFTRHPAMNLNHPTRLSAPSAQLVVKYAPNWPSDYPLPSLQGEVMGMALWFASMAYGGIHLAAWHDNFPSRTETVLWRFSAIYISSSGVFWFLLNVFAHYPPWASSWWDRFYAMKAHPVQYVLLGSGATVCGVSYILARVFLVVDGIASLRSVPSAIYSTPDWSVLVPHL